MVKSPNRYSDEAWKEITNVSCVDVAMALGYTVDEKRSDRNALHMADSGGLFVWRNGQGYYRHTTETKGNAVQLVQEEKNCSYKQALDFINENVLGMKFETEIYKRDIPQNEKGNMQLPEFTQPNRVFAYLSKTRGIDPEIISALLKEGSIRQDKQYGNCCFIGSDPQGKARYCSTRGTGSVQYRGELLNSDKNFGFFIPGKSDILKVFESPIEAMSHATLAKLTGRDWKEDTRLSLGGTAGRALEQHLKDYPGRYKEIWVCLNNDVDGTRKDPKTGEEIPYNAGQEASTKMAEKYNEDYTVRIKQPFYKDFNDDLKTICAFMSHYNCDIFYALDFFKNEKATLEQGEEQPQTEIQSQNEYTEISVELLDKFKSEVGKARIAANPTFLPNQEWGSFLESHINETYYPERINETELMAEEEYEEAEFG
jgi:hypothetical protein